MKKSAPSRHMTKQNLLYRHRRLLLILFFIFTIFGVSGCGQAASEPESVTVGVINLAPVLDPVFDGFKDEMAELGYIEGENITYIYDGPVGDIARLGDVAQDLVDREVDLILALSTPAAQATMAATQEIPIVFAPISDPINAGLVTNLANPGGNATGVQWALSEPKRLQWLVDLAPGTEQIYVPYNPEDGAATAVLGTMDETAVQLNVTLLKRETRNNAEITAAIDDIPPEADAILLLPDNLVVSRIDDIAAAAITQKLPLTAPGETTAEAGALMAYGLRFYPAGQQSARMAHKILQGSDPGELPIETTEFFLSINLKTAAAIDLPISDEALRQADTIIRE